MYRIIGEKRWREMMILIWCRKRRRWRKIAKEKDIFKATRQRKTLVYISPTTIITTTTVSIRQQARLRARKERGQAPLIDIYSFYFSLSLSSLTGPRKKKSVYVSKQLRWWWWSILNMHNKLRQTKSLTQTKQKQERVKQERESESNTAILLSISSLSQQGKRKDMIWKERGWSIIAWERNKNKQTKKNKERIEIHRVG